MPRSSALVDWEWVGPGLAQISSNLRTQYIDGGIRSICPKFSGQRQMHIVPLPNQSVGPTLVVHLTISTGGPSHLHCTLQMKKVTSQKHPFHSYKFTLDWIFFLRTRCNQSNPLPLSIAYTLDLFLIQTLLVVEFAQKPS